MVKKEKYDVEGELREWFGGAGRVVVVGVGNPIRMNDFVGVAVVRGLRGKVDADRVMLIEAETISEDHMRKVIDYKPTHILIIDAVQLGLRAGESRLISSERIADFPAFSTHVLPLRIFCEYLSKLIKTAIALLLIEPERTEFGEELSSAVMQSGQKIARALRTMFT